MTTWRHMDWTKLFSPRNQDAIRWSMCSSSPNWVEETYEWYWNSEQWYCYATPYFELCDIRTRICNYVMAGHLKGLRCACKTHISFCCVNMMSTKEKWKTKKVWRDKCLVQTLWGLRQPIVWAQDGTRNWGMGELFSEGLHREIVTGWKCSVSSLFILLLLCNYLRKWEINWFLLFSHCGARRSGSLHNYLITHSFWLFGNM